MISWWNTIAKISHDDLIQFNIVLIELEYIQRRNLCRQKLFFIIYQLSIFKLLVKNCNIREDQQ